MSHQGVLGLRLFATGVFLVVWCLLTSEPAWAGQEVLAVALAPKIHSRQPVRPFTPPAHCEKDQNGQDSVPVIDVSVTEKVYFWTRIASTSRGKIRHTWHQEIKGHWQQLSYVDLQVRPSASFRTWSKKTIFPQRHVGNWMIVVAPSNDPDHILCISRFIVK